MTTEEAIQVIKEIKANKTRGTWMEEACENLVSIAKEHPEVASRVLDTFKTLSRLEQDNTHNQKNEYDQDEYDQENTHDKNSISYIYSALEEMLDAHPKLVYDVLDTFETVFRKGKNTNDSLLAAYNNLGNIFGKQVVKEQPKLTKWCTEIFKEGMEDVSDISQSVSKVVGTRPELAPQFLKIINGAKRSIPDFCVSFSCLDDIVKADQSLAGKVVSMLNAKTLQNIYEFYEDDGNDYSLVETIIDADPKLGDKVFKIFNERFKSDKGVIPSLSDIVEAHPEFTSQYVDIANTVLRLDEYNTEDLDTDCTYVLAIVEKRPELAPQIFNLYGQLLKSDKHGRTFSGEDSLDNYYFHLEEALIVNKHLEYAGCVLEAMAGAKESVANRKVYLCKACMSKDCRKYVSSLDDLLAKYPDDKELRIAYNGRFVSDKVFKYAMEHIDRKSLVNPSLFSNQQIAMNALEAVSKESHENQDWLVSASFKLSALFPGKTFKQYINDMVLRHNERNPADALSIHDAVYWLPKPMDKEASEHFAKFLTKEGTLFYVNNEGKEVHRSTSELGSIARNWMNLEKEAKDKGEDITKYSYDKILESCRHVIYTDVRHKQFAAEAKQNGLSKKMYHRCEDIYLAGLWVPEPFDSTKRFEVVGSKDDKDNNGKKYVGRFLPRDDARVGFFGNYTGCCQHFGGDGHACAVSTVKDPFSQLFVVENKEGKIIAGSWVWENTEGEYRDVCFDNIESLGGYKYSPIVNKIYIQAGKYLAQEENCRYVTIGTANNDMIKDKSDETELSPGEKPFELHTVEPIPLPSLYTTDREGADNYTDAFEQVLLDANPNARPLDKTQKSQRYVRHACYLDIDEMQKVSSSVFPEGDQELQVPENMEGFVIEDAKKGVVGYCLFDRNEKSIYDMAVLEDYRRDGNPSSSTRLFTEMMKIIKEEGGKWSAEMRDTTTLKYLDIMSRRGEVKYKELGVDHVMSDGSKVVKVEFEPVKQAEKTVEQEGEKGSSLRRELRALKEAKLETEERQPTRRLRRQGNTRRRAQNGGPDHA